jgi:hypothetical protein
MKKQIKTLSWFTPTIIECGQKVVYMFTLNNSMLRSPARTFKHFMYNRLNDRGSSLGTGSDFHFVTTPRPPLGPTQPEIQSSPGSLHLRSKADNPFLIVMSRSGVREPLSPLSHTSYYLVLRNRSNFTVVWNSVIHNVAFHDVHESKFFS